MSLIFFFFGVTISSSAPIDTTSQTSTELLLSETSTNIMKVNGMNLISAFNTCQFKVMIKKKCIPLYLAGSFKTINNTLQKRMVLVTHWFITQNYHK